MKSITYQIVGHEPLLMNNPQTVDPFNSYAKLKKTITSKRKKTDDDLLKLRTHEVESKLYFDDDLAVFVPSSWIIAAISGISWAKCKIKKADIRSCIFPTKSRLKLYYDGFKKVRSLKDISSNETFITTQLLKQGQVKIAKCSPIFHNWHFETKLEFDDSIVNESDLRDLITHSAKYGGFGDFRPTYGRAEAKFIA